MICLPLLITARLGISIGIHFSCNLVQGVIFGFAISGDIAKTPMVNMEMPNNLLTGGVFGPEEGLLLILLDIIAVMLVLYWKKFKTNTDTVERIIYISL